MRSFRWVFCAASLVLPSACLEGPALPQGGAGGAVGGFEVQVEPQADLQKAPRALRLRITSSTPLVAGQLALFEGELSSYHRGRITRNDLPRTLEARRVPLEIWGGDGVGSPVSAAPRQLLEPDTVYSVALLGVGVLEELRVRAEPGEALLRVWPPRDVPSAARYAVYCAADPGDELPTTSDESRPTSDESPPASDESPTTALAEATRPETAALWTGELEPYAASAALWSGVDARATEARRCVHLVLDDPLPLGESVLPPLGALAGELEPLPLVSEAVESSQPVPCVAEELAIAPGCLETQDDRLLIRTPTAPALWSLGGEQVAWFAAGQGPWVVYGLEPDRAYELQLLHVDLAGHQQLQQLDLRTKARREHVAINEVFANPIGPEPQQEWIELVNTGTGITDLEGWLLEDLGAATPLPRFLIEPGELVLVVRDDFDPSGAVDVAPAPGTRLIHVPTLGKSGLSNAGELLRLRDPALQVMSSVPAGHKSKAGVSVARRLPWALSERADSFAPHAAPGASPGQSNAF